MKVLHVDSSIQGSASATRELQVIVAVARGGVYEAGSPAEFGESYLRFVLGFLGIRDVTFVRAEGLAFSPQHRDDAMSAAHAAISMPAALAA